MSFCLIVLGCAPTRDDGCFIMQQKEINGGVAQKKCEQEVKGENKHCCTYIRPSVHNGVHYHLLNRLSQVILCSPLFPILVIILKTQLSINMYTIGIIGAGHVGCALAFDLSERGNKVVLRTMLRHPGNTPNILANDGYLVATGCLRAVSLWKSATDCRNSQSPSSWSPFHQPASTRPLMSLPGMT